MVWGRGVLLAGWLATAACSSDAATDDTSGAGGGGGAAPGCAAGSHDDGTGVCVATLGAFGAAPSLTDARDHHVTWAAERPGGTFMYVLGGGLDMMSTVQTIERTKVAEDGTLAPWETLPQTLAAVGPMVVSTDDFVVIAGGQRPISASAKVSVSTVADDGALAFVDGPTMLHARFHGAAVLVDGRIYATGGLDAGGTSLASVETTTLDGSTLGAWQEATPLPAPTSHHGLATDGHALYVTGGIARENGDFANDVPYDTIYRAAIASDGALEPWTEIGKTPVAISVHASFVHAGHLYLMHGLDSVESRFMKTVQRAPLAEDGTLGAWEELGVILPKTRGHCHQTPIVNGFLYSIGGTNSSGSQVEAYVARFE